MQCLRGYLGALALAVAASPLWASLDRSPIPQPRPGTIAPSTPVSVAPVATISASAAPVLRSPIPQKRPRTFVGTTPAPSAATPVSYGRAGSVCGIKDIRGRARSAIPGKLGGCGVDAPVEVTEVAGVKLSTTATMDCTTAKALRTWIEKGVKPAVGRLGGGVSSLKVAASYSCRTRNNQPGGKISEHGKGRAIDISAVTLNNGVSMSVLKGWNDPLQGKVLRKMHRAACGPFGTVLGPEADRYHKDHFHFDTARYRSGSYCR